MSQLVNLNELDAPNVLEDLDFEQLLAERKQQFIALYPEAEQAHWQNLLSLESEPIVKLLEENCYLQLLERKRINEAAKATMLAYATGTDLDIIAANFNVQRLILQAADPNANPPLAEIKESDEDLRLRTQLAFEGLSTAGPRNAYIFHGLAAHSDIADISVESPAPAQVLVTVLAKSGKGTASQAVLTAVDQKLNEETIRPIADRVVVQSATIKDYQVKAKLHLYQGPEAELIKTQAQKRLAEYVSNRHRLGRDISLSGIYSALHIEGVQRVELTAPSKDIVLTSSQAGYCTAITLETVISDDR